MTPIFPVIYSDFFEFAWTHRQILATKKHEEFFSFLFLATKVHKDTQRQEEDGTLGRWEERKARSALRANKVLVISVSGRCPADEFYFNLLPKRQCH